MSCICGVEQWPDEAYRSYLRAESGGMSGRTHLALLAPPVGEPCRGFVKHFDPATHPRALFNEWFSVHLLQALSIPVPRCALLRAPTGGPGPLSWAFVSCEASPTSHGTPKQFYSLTDQAANQVLASRLLATAGLPQLIAADQLIANGDRNLGNVVFTGTHSMVAIDHDHALHGPAWSFGQLWCSQHPCRSTLLDFVLEVRRGELPPPVASAVVAAAEVVQEAYYAAQDDLRSIMNAANHSETATAMDATWWRCNDLAQWFKIRLDVI